MAFHPLVIEFSGEGAGEMKNRLKEILVKVFDFIVELGQRTSVTVCAIIFQILLFFKQ